MIRTTKAKTIAAAIGALCTVVAGVFADDVLGTDEIGSLIAGIVAAAATVYGVFVVPNKPVEPQ